LKQSLKMMLRHPGISSVSDILTSYKKWKTAGYDGIFHNPMPWMAEAAVRFISSACRPDSRVFEFGSGASTLFFSSRVSEVCSVEHNPDWYKAMKEEISGKGISNVTLHLKPGQPAESGQVAGPAEDPLQYSSVFEAYNKVHFRDYAAMIDHWPEESFDLIVVDGRARPSCLLHAWPRLKKGGLLVLDNSDRPHYQPQCSEIDRLALRKWKFYGPVAQNPMFQETSFWKK
jgi:predicted O-methyltransferase YrrM